MQSALAWIPVLLGSGVVVAVVTQFSQWLGSRNEHSVALREAEILSKLDDKDSEAAKNLLNILARRTKRWERTSIDFVRLLKAALIPLLIGLALISIGLLLMYRQAVGEIALQLEVFFGQEIETDQEVGAALQVFIPTIIVLSGLGVLFLPAALIVTMTVSEYLQKPQHRHRHAGDVEGGDASVGDSPPRTDPGWRPPLPPSH